MKRSILFIALGVVIFVGCRTTPPNFVVLRDVPENPSFVVIPFNNYQEQIDFARMIESALIASGVKVVQRPEKLADVEVSKDANMGAIDKKGAVMKEGAIDSRWAGARKVARYSEWEDVDADYIVYTSGSVGYRKKMVLYESSVSIIKKGSREVLSSFLVHHRKINKEVNDALKAMGIPVRSIEQ